MVYLLFWALLEMKSNANFQGAARCSSVLDTTSLTASSPPAAISGPQHQLLCLFGGFMNKCMGRRGSFPYTRAALGFLLPVTCNIKQTRLCVVPAVLHTMVCSLCFPGAQRSSPGAPESISSAWIVGKGFLGLFCQACIHHGSDCSVTSSCQHLS